MTVQLVEVEPDRPRTRQLKPVIASIQAGGVIACPGDSGYALLCDPLQTEPVRRIRQLRKLKSGHHLTLLCEGLGQLGNWALVDTPGYRLMKRLVPGPYTFILQAGKDSPRRILQPKKKSLGLRFPDSPLSKKMLQMNGGPLLTTSLILPGQSEPADQIDPILASIGTDLDFLLYDRDLIYPEPTTVLDLRTWPPEVLRQGSGDTSFITA